MKDTNLITYHEAASLSHYSIGYLHNAILKYPHLMKREAGKVRIYRDKFMDWVANRPKQGRKAGGK